MIRALITSKNSPKVKMVTGKVNKIRMGFIKKLSKAKTIATTIEVIKESTLTPPRKLASKVTKIAVTSNLIIKFIKQCLIYYLFSVNYKGITKKLFFLFKFEQI